MTPNQREDLDRELQHEARDYEEWKPCNRRQKDDWSDRTVWILWTTVWLLVGVLVVFALNWLESLGRHL